MRKRALKLADLFNLILAFVCIVLPVSGQVQQNNLEARINRQNARIDAALKRGALSAEQAQKLHQDLADIGHQINLARQTNDGKLKPNDLVTFKSQLGQTNALIGGYEQAGQRKLAGAEAAGPAWAAGKDGAQNVAQLKRRMKIQERQQLRQEDQAMLQVKEQQQQQYEKEMLEKLGAQRPAILKNEGDIDKIRQSTGAN
jgi:hypothetical protein